MDLLSVGWQQNRAVSAPTFSTERFEDSNSSTCCSSQMIPSLSFWHPTHQRGSIQFKARCRFKIPLRIGCLIAGSCPLPPSSSSFTHSHFLFFFLQETRKLLETLLQQFADTFKCFFLSQCLWLFVVPFWLSGLDRILFQTSWSVFSISSVHFILLFDKITSHWLDMLNGFGLGASTRGCEHTQRSAFLLLEGQLLDSGSLSFPGYKHKGFWKIYSEPWRPFPT